MSTTPTTSINSANFLERPHRNFWKCKKCRHDNKRCEPRDREWEVFAEKCLRCAQLGEPCGPSEKVQTKRKSKRPADDVSGMHSGNEISAESPQRAYSFHHLASSTQNAENQIDNQSYSERSHKLAVAVATLRLLLRCRSEIARSRWSTHSLPVLDEQDSLLLTFCRTLQQYFENSTNSASDAIQRLQRDELLTSAAKLGILQWYFQTIQIQEPCRDDQNWFSNDRKTFLETNSSIMDICTVFIDARIMLCTASALSGTHSFFNGHHSRLDLAEQLCASDYDKAGKEVQALIRDLKRKVGMNQGNTDHGTKLLDSQNIATAFPASHIAYWNNKPTLAFQLCMQDGTLHLAPNMLGQTLVHLATQACDLKTLKMIVDEDGDAIRKTNRDACGQSVSEIAIALNDQDLFSFLFQRGANIEPQLPNDPSLLQLAVCEGKFAIVKHILAYPNIETPPYTKMVAFAIERGFEEIAMCFVGWLEEPWTSVPEINELARMACEHRLYNLMSKLNNLSASRPTAEESLRSLDRIFTPFDDRHSFSYPDDSTPSQESFFEDPGTSFESQVFGQDYNHPDGTYNPYS